MDDSHNALPPTERFSDRVDLYERFRPAYPAAIVPFLQRSIGLSSEIVIADIGSGTGLLAELFLRAGNEVYAVEPNDEMRAVAESRFSSLENFRSIKAVAEATTLPDRSIGLITAGQAFHWFELDAARREFRRILQPDGWVALVYNSWNVPDSPVAADYAALMNRYGVDYERVKRQNRLGDETVRFFGGDGPRKESFPNDQGYDLEALYGRAFSSSYAPLSGHPSHDPLVEGLRQLFDDHAVDGRLQFPYITTVYWGKLR